jgi:hypothetical protein
MPRAFRSNIAITGIRSLPFGSAKRSKSAGTSGRSQHVYADLDGRYVELPVIGDYPDVWEADWEAARAGVRALGRAYQADGGRAADGAGGGRRKSGNTPRRVRTKEARRQAKRREGEGRPWPICGVQNAGGQARDLETRGRTRRRLGPDRLMGPAPSLPFWIAFDEARNAVETIVDVAHDDPEERPRASS